MKTYPDINKYIKPYYIAKEYYSKRELWYILFFDDISANDVKYKFPELSSRIWSVQFYRRGKKSIDIYADTPEKLGEMVLSSNVTVVPKSQSAVLGKHLICDILEVEGVYLNSSFRQIKNSQK